MRFFTNMWGNIINGSNQLLRSKTFAKTFKVHCSWNAVFLIFSEICTYSPRKIMIRYLQNAEESQLSMSHYFGDIDNLTLVENKILNAHWYSIYKGSHFQPLSVVCLCRCILTTFAVLCNKIPITEKHHSSRSWRESQRREPSSKAARPIPPGTPPGTLPGTPPPAAPKPQWGNA